MEESEVPEHYFTSEGRLASFYSTQPVTNRKSTAKGKAPKSLAWPHKQLDPTSLARAGFYFDPTPDYPDNAVCFLCHKRVGGWEDGDDPIEEHLRLSPRCGWAIVTAIEAGLGDYSADDPSHPYMMEARKDTFAGRWPHEGKRGWKCKTKQMVDAGWKYTPTLDSDDMATCTYCQLALDGWEPSDKPMNEHYKRSPECPFFILINEYQQGPAKKAGRGKGARASKASRLSSQSVATLASEAPSMLDQPADYEDSVMTTTSVATAGGTKRGRAKKTTTTTTKGRKTKGKKDEPVEVLEDPEDDLPPPPPPKPTRGRKRASDTIEDSVLTNAEAPAPKKRATRARNSNMVDSSAIEPDQSMADPLPGPPAKTTKKKGGRTSKSTRKVSTASTLSNSSFHNAAEEFPDDTELDRQLQADLDRPLSDDDMIAADSDSERKKAPARGKGKQATVKKPAAIVEKSVMGAHAMFAPAPAPTEMDDADMSAELRELREQMESEAQEALQVPKKGRKAGTRKTSKQTKAQKAQQAAEDQEAEPQPGVEPVSIVEDAPPPSEQLEQHDISLASNATVLKSSTVSAPAPKKRGRPKKISTQPPPQPAAEPEVVSEETQLELPAEVEQIDFADPLAKAATPRVSLGAGKPRKKSLPPPPAPEDELQGPSTPGPVVAATPAARQATISPSQSPQSSDAENQPPSSKPSNTSNSSRIALAPLAATPVRSSPSKRNVNLLDGLQSEKPWTAIGIDQVFEEIGKENAVPESNLLKGTQLTSPEKKMTVEEWVYHNASLAEQRLKVECENMVSKFEREGGKAMRSLEELVVEG